MPNPVITSRPEKTISGFDSKWNAAGGDLPVQYEITNTKFPISSEGGTSELFVIYNSNTRNQPVLVYDSAPAYSAGGFIYIEDGIYQGGHQIVSINGNVVVIRTEYLGVSDSSSIPFFGNYTTIIDVYAGIESGHPYESDDPISLVGSIEQVPDSDNITRVDVSDYIKRKMSEVNNPDALTEANYLDLWTDFYIVVRERYIDSSGTLQESSDVTDSANVLHGIYGVLQFGNTYGGNMYEYIASDDTYAPTAKWLTDFTTLEYFPQTDQFDVCIINECEDPVFRVKQYDKDDIILSTSEIQYANSGRGVYRFKLQGFELETNTTYFLVSLVCDGNVLSEELRINYNESLCLDTDERPQLSNYWILEDSDGFFALETSTDDLFLLEG